MTSLNRPASIEKLVGWWELPSANAQPIGRARVLPAAGRHMHRAQTNGSHDNLLVYW